MHILILSQYYDPEPIRKPIELAEELRDLGHRVSVITGYPNYPSGKLYSGYELKFMQSNHDKGISITRTFEYPYHGKSALGRILNYISFMLTAPFGLIRTRNIDVIYVWHPPLTIGIAAWWISTFSGAPFVYDVQDIWPESVAVSGLVNNIHIINIMKLIERFVYKKASSLIVVTNGARRNLIEKGVDEKKIRVLPHWTDESIFQKMDHEQVDHIRKKHKLEDKFVFMFAGNLGTVQGLETIISSAALLKGLENVLVVFVGEGSDGPRLKELVSSHGLEEMVLFIDQQPIENIPQYLAAADVLLVHLKPSALADYVIPSKTTAYLAAGKPILMAAGGASSELIDEIGSGITIDPGNPEVMSVAMREFLRMEKDIIDDMGRKGRDYFLTHLAKEQVIPLYEKLLLDAFRN